MVSLINKHTKKSFPISVLISIINQYVEDRIFTHLCPLHLSQYFLFSFNFLHHGNISSFPLFAIQGWRSFWSAFIIFILIEFFQLNVQVIFFFITEILPTCLPSHPPLCLSPTPKTKFPGLESANGVINALQRFPKVFTHAERFCFIFRLPVRTQGQSTTLVLCTMQ